MGLCCGRLQQAEAMNSSFVYPGSVGGLAFVAMGLIPGSGGIAKVFVESVGGFGWEMGEEAGDSHEPGYNTLHVRANIASGWRLFQMGAGGW